MMPMAIYKPGSLWIESFTNEDGIVAYSGGKTVEEYLKDLDFDDFVEIPFNEALALVAEEHNKLASRPWKEISKEDYWYALECLPPSKWQRVNGVEFFQSSEEYSFGVTSTYAQYNKKYFSALRKTSCNYETLSSEIKELAHV